MLTFKCFSNEEPCNPVEERKFIISMSKLLELFNTCKRCHRRATASVQQTVGTMVRVGAECEFCGFSWQWSSQPSLRNITAGNLAYSAGILFSGALSAKGLRIKENFLFPPSFYPVPCHCWGMKQTPGDVCQAGSGPRGSIGYWWRWTSGFT